MKNALVATILVLAVAPGLALANHGAAKPTQPVFRPHVFNLVNAGGNFESSGAGQRPGWRTVGFWSYRTPRVGDMIVKRGNAGGLSVWELEQVGHNFTGSNGETFWRGLMRDLVFTNTMTQTHVEAIHDAARTQPELLPR